MDKLIIAIGAIFVLLVVIAVTNRTNDKVRHAKRTYSPSPDDVHVLSFHLEKKVDKAA